MRFFFKAARSLRRCWLRLCKPWPRPTPNCTPTHKPTIPRHLQRRSSSTYQDYRYRYCRKLQLPGVQQRGNGRRPGAGNGQPTDSSGAASIFRRCLSPTGRPRAGPVPGCRYQSNRLLCASASGMRKLHASVGGRMQTLPGKHRAIAWRNGRWSLTRLPASSGNAAAIPMVTVSSITQTKTPSEAASYCRQPGLPGSQTWRLPSIKELYSLIQFSGRDASSYAGTSTAGLTPFIDPVFDWTFGDQSAGDRIIDAQYATSTHYVWTTMDNTPTMFGVNFVDGRIKGYPANNAKNTMCVVLLATWLRNYPSPTTARHHYRSRDRTDVGTERPSGTGPGFGLVDLRADNHGRLQRLAPSKREELHSIPGLQPLARHHPP